MSATVMNKLDPTNIVCSALAGLRPYFQPTCTSTDVANGNFVEAYFPQNSTICQSAALLQTIGVAYNLKCCAEDSCNSPSNSRPAIVSDTSPSTSTLMLPANILTSSSTISAQVLPAFTTPQPLQCYIGAENMTQLQPVARNDFRRMLTFFAVLRSQEPLNSVTCIACSHCAAFHLNVVPDGMHDA